MSLLDDPVLGLDDIDAAVAVVVEGLRAVEPDVALPRVQRIQRRLAVVETEKLAERKRAGASDADNQNAAGRGSTRSNADAKKHTDRADTINENPSLGIDLDNETLSPEQLDAIAWAASQSDGAAASDDALISRIKNANPDQAKSIARAWVEDHKTPDDIETEHDRQRRMRKVSKFTTRNGLAALMAEGDKTTIDQLFKLIDADSRKLYDTDGGRDLPTGQHPRTRDQRLFDALANRITRQPTDAGKGDTPAQPARPTVVLAQTTPDGVDSAEIIGTGPIPASVLERLMCDCDLIGALFDKQGQPLWLGRRSRMVSKAQWLALVARDKGCVQCGADPTFCEAHHLIPWHAPARGHTDITNLALLCSNCHHHVHDTKQTLERAPDTGQWRLRPATPDEIPPPRAKSPP